MVTRRFSLEDQLAFAHLSGDFNPVHIDPLTARRTMFGSPIVHGMHVLLWVLSEWDMGDDTQRLVSLKATFTRPVRLDEDVAFSVKDLGNGRHRISITTNGARAANLSVTLAAASEPKPDISEQTPDRTEPRLLGEAALKDDVMGRVPGHCNPADVSRAGIAPSGRVTRRWIAALAGASRIVGMECPGLNSVFGEIELAQDAAVPDPDLRWTLTSYDPRFRFVDLSVSGLGLSGRIGAFLRPEIMGQTAPEVIRARARPGAFSGHRALVVGGSRGLGAVTARLLAAGGADVLLTYARGASDADEVAHAIRTAGGRAKVAQFDVTQGPGADVCGFKPTMLAYFATPFAFAGARNRFDPELFERYRAVYVDGFRRVFDGTQGTLRGVFYPSSVAIDEAPDDMAEYAAAKDAGETLCATLAEDNPHIRFLVPRLPRLETDQTQTLSPVENADPVPLIADFLDLFARD